MTPRPDAVVFDVDGVLVDTESSYIEAVVRTVQWLLVHELHIADDGPAVDRAIVHAWKRSGRWNDDWDLSYAMLEWLAAAPGATTTARRRAAGDPKAAAQRAVTFDRARWEAIRGVFEEIYNGTPVATSRYGVAARVNAAHGLAETERVLLTADVLRELLELGIDKVGIVTGRSIVDWEPIAARMPVPVDVAVATMEDGKKPDPAPLAKVVRMLRPRAFVAVGDTMADLEMVTRWNATAAGRTTPGTAVMLCPAEDEPAYRERGASLFIRSVDELPSLVRSASSPPATR